MSIVSTYGYNPYQTNNYSYTNLNDIVEEPQSQPAPTTRPGFSAKPGPQVTHVLKEATNESNLFLQARQDVIDECEAQIKENDRNVYDFNLAAYSTISTLGNLIGGLSFINHKKYSPYCQAVKNQTCDNTTMICKNSCSNLNYSDVMLAVGPVLGAAMGFIGARHYINNRNQANEKNNEIRDLGNEVTDWFDKKTSEYESNLKDFRSLVVATHGQEGYDDVVSVIGRETLRLPKIDDDRPLSTYSYY